MSWVYVLVIETSTLVDILTDVPKTANISLSSEGNHILLLTELYFDLLIQSIGSHKLDVIHIVRIPDVI